MYIHTPYGRINKSQLMYLKNILLVLILSFLVLSRNKNKTYGLMLFVDIINLICSGLNQFFNIKYLTTATNCSKYQISSYYFMIRTDYTFKYN